MVNEDARHPPAEPAASCGEFIGLLDQAAVAALISRSSLGTPEASRLRRGTPPGRIAEILRRRQLPPQHEQPDQVSELPAIPMPDDAGPPPRVTCDDGIARVYEYLVGELADDDAIARVHEYLVRELADDDRVKIRQHLEDCGACLREYGLAAAARRLVKQHRDPAPEGLQDKSAVIREITRPDPLSARTPEELAAVLREFRHRPGAPTLIELARRCGTSKGAMHHWLLGRERPSLEALIAIITACDGTEDDQARWTAAWHQVYAAARRGPTRNSQPGSQPVRSTDGRQQGRDDWGERIERVNADGYPNQSADGRGQGAGAQGPPAPSGHPAARGSFPAVPPGGQVPDKGGLNPYDAAITGSYPYPGPAFPAALPGAAQAGPAQPGVDDDPLTSQAYSRPDLSETDGRSYRVPARRSQAQAKLTEQAEADFLARHPARTGTSLDDDTQQKLRDIQDLIAKLEDINKKLALPARAVARPVVPETDQDNAPRA